MADNRGPRLNPITPHRAAARSPPHEATSRGEFSASHRGTSEPQRSADAREFLARKAKAKENSAALGDEHVGTSNKRSGKAAEREPVDPEEDNETKALESYAEYAEMMYLANQALLARGKPARPLLPPPVKPATTKTDNVRARARLTLNEESVHSSGNRQRAEIAEKSEERRSALNRLGGRGRIPIQERLGSARADRDVVPRREEESNKDARVEIRERREGHHLKSWGHTATSRIQGDQEHGDALFLPVD